MELKTPLYDAHVKAGGKIVPLQDISYRYSMEQVLSQSIWQLEKKQDFSMCLIWERYCAREKMHLQTCRSC